MRIGLYKPLLIVLIMFMGAVFLPYSPAHDLKSPRNSSSSPFGANIYKVATEIKGPDKGDVSVNYQVGAGNIWQTNGYNAELWAFCSDCHTYTTSGLPGNGGFDQSLTANANDGRPFYTIQDSSASVPGAYLAEQNTVPTFVNSSSGSFHSLATVPGSTFGWSGITQDFTSHFWYTPLVSDITFTGSLYPARLDDTTRGLDALIVFEFDLSYWNQSTAKNRMFFVFQNNATASLASFPYSNSTDAYTRVFALSGSTHLNFNRWNFLSWNITSIAIESFGYWKGLDERITDLTVQSWSDNGATSEFYLDTLGLASASRTTASSQIYHNTEESILSHYNSNSSFPLVSGVTDWGTPQDIIWFDTTNYPGTGAASTNTQIGVVQSGGGYPFIAAPYDTSTVYNVSAVPVYSNAQSWAGASTQAGGSGQWDRYLTSGVYAMGYAEQHAYILSAVDGYALNGPATFAYSDSLSGTSIVEAIAQGRSFGEYTWFKTGTMSIYFAAENDNVGMGRFPVYVDPSTMTVSLHVKLGNMPILSSPLTLRIIRDGVVIDNVPMPSQVTSYDNVLSYSIPNTSDYFRFEVYNAGVKILAYSNPIFFSHANLLNSYWLAETPRLAYGTAKSFLSNIQQDQSSLQFTVNGMAGIPITTTVNYPNFKGSVAGATSWSYDQTSSILSISTTGTQQIVVSAVSTASLLSVVQGINGALYWNSFLSGSWSGWQVLSGPVASAPVLCPSGPTTVEVFVRGMNNATFHRTFSGSRWSSWDDAGGATLDPPSCAVFNGVLYLAVRGLNNATWLNTMTLGAASWNGWIGLGGVIQSSPVLVASPQAGRLDLIVNGMDNGIWHKSLTLQNAWSSWDSAGGQLIGIPAVVGNGAGLNLAARWFNNDVVYNRLVFGSSWSGWTNLAGAAASRPSLALDPGGIAHLWVRGLNDVVYQKSSLPGQTGGSDWTTYGASTLDSVGVVYSGSASFVMIRGTDNGIYSLTVPSSQSWTGLGGATEVAPAIVDL